MLFFGELCDEAGLPARALNIVTGRGSTIGNDLISHSGINKVSFTGSTEEGVSVGVVWIKNVSEVTLRHDMLFYIM